MRYFLAKFEVLKVVSMVPVLSDITPCGLLLHTYQRSKDNFASILGIVPVSYPE
jgi:hypothetical protein